ncbi:SANT/Myb_domain [Hexamita inflata]|uniref:SANT/Myb domain n=1 Tax=Hexamita inflata TaxID=28002 RepID=A0AA86PR95_9EUKA|nr:SANT/Myb domain [Hexamita inflata]CAI9939634.1 SANT/Myb domain [Hexamita inflata]CAI9962943.1 SANT/Myb domain [Hexamita inflata]
MITLENMKFIYQELSTQIQETQAQIEQIQSNRIFNSQNKQNMRLRQRDRWTADEDKLLIQQLQIHGIKGQALFNIPTKSSNQVYYRLRYLKQVYLQQKSVHEHTKYDQTIDLSCFKLFCGDY